MTEHIQINAVTPRVQYLADGNQTAFTYPFAVFTASDLEVWLDEDRLDGGFAVSGAGSSTGGVVTFAVPPVPGIRVTLRRQLALARTSDYQADGIIRAKTLNDELDYQVAALQQVAEGVGRAVKQALTSSSTADLTLPAPQAGRSLKWNADGAGLVNTAIDPDTLGSALVDTLAAREVTLAARDVALTARDQAVAAASQLVEPLVRSYNLSDLTDPAAARDNLGVGSAAVRDIGTAMGDVPALQADGKLSPDILPAIDLSTRVAKAGDTMTGELAGTTFRSSGTTATATGFKLANGADIGTLFPAAGAAITAASGSGTGFGTNNKITAVSLSKSGTTAVLAVTANCNCNCDCTGG